MSERIQKLLDSRPPHLQTELSLADDGKLILRPPRPMSEQVLGDAKYEYFVLDQSDVVVFTEKGDDTTETLRVPIAQVEEVDMAFREALPDGTPRHAEQHQRAYPAYVRIFHRSEPDAPLTAIALGVGWHATDHGVALANESGLTEAEAQYLAKLITALVQERGGMQEPEASLPPATGFAESIGHPPKGRLSASRRGDEWVVSARSSSVAGFVIPGFLIGVALIAAARLWDVPFMIPGVIFVSVTGLLFLLATIVRARLHIRPDSVTYTTNLWPKSWAETLTADEIAAVVVERRRDVNKQDTKHHHLVIRAKGGKEPIEFGLTVTKKELQWVKKAIEQALASRR